MSLPIAATGPLKVLMKPILIGLLLRHGGRRAQNQERGGRQQDVFHVVYPPELLVVLARY